MPFVVVGPPGPNWGPPGADMWQGWKGRFSVPAGGGGLEPFVQERGIMVKAARDNLTPCPSPARSGENEGAHRRSRAD